MGCFFIRFLGFLLFFREYNKCACVDNICLNFKVPSSFKDFLMMYPNQKYLCTTLVCNNVMSQIFRKDVNYCKFHCII